MIQNLIGMISKAFTPTATTSITPVRQAGANPFAVQSTNPFLNSVSLDKYGKNNPVKGGYFAGYYNGKPNIVGRKLFLEV